jgi:hypothetical protein
MVVPADPGPPDRGGDRPDMQRRGRLDPRNPPAGYYASADELPLSSRVAAALRALRKKFSSRR